MKETKKMKFTECLSHLFVFIKPYRFKLLFGILPKNKTWVHALKT